MQTYHVGHRCTWEGTGETQEQVEIPAICFLGLLSAWEMKRSQLRKMVLDIFWGVSQPHKYFFPLKFLIATGHEVFQFLFSSDKSVAKPITSVIHCFGGMQLWHCASTRKVNPTSRFSEAVHDLPLRNYSTSLHLLLPYWRRHCESSQSASVLRSYGPVKRAGKLRQMRYRPSALHWDECST